MMKPGNGRGGLLVIGNLNVDRIYAVDRIPSEGQSVPVSGEAVRFGGCGGNIALAAARLGVSTRLSSVVGPDIAPEYIQRIRDAGIDESDIVTIPDLPSPYCIILSTSSGAQAFAFRMGAMSEQGKMEVPDPTGLSFCHAATSDPAYCTKVFRKMREEGVQTALDPGQEIFFRWDRRSLTRALESSNRFFGNLREWIQLGDLMEWERGAEEIPLYPKAFELIEESIVTLGDRGAALIRDGSVIIDPASGTGGFVDATGAGDAFRGAFYGALIRGSDSPAALHSGNLMGGFVTRFMGPQEYSISWDELTRC